MVSTTHGTFSRGFSRRSFSAELGDVHFAFERQLLLGVGRLVDGAVHGVAAAELDVSFVVSKWELPSTMSPSLSSAEKMTFSAARP